MRNAAELATAAGGTDVRAGLQAARALRRLAETLEAAQVENARRQGWSWTEIAAVLEVTKQAVHQRYARRLPAVDTQES
jgi:DNA-directed RNA polymerase specialized sigma24 family protein